MASARRLLATHSPVASTESEWPAGRVRVSAYVGEVALPPEIPGRVRCLVTDGFAMLVTWDLNGIPDCLPGGGADTGESIADTAAREVWEETGWHIDVASIRVLGWMHVESFAGPNPDHLFPHPDVFMPVIHARPSHADDDRPAWADVEGSIARSSFIPISELPASIRSSPIHAPFLALVFGNGWRSK